MASSSNRIQCNSLSTLQGIRPRARDSRLLLLSLQKKEIWERAVAMKSKLLCFRGLVYLEKRMTIDFNNLHQEWRLTILLCKKVLPIIQGMLKWLKKMNPQIMQMIVSKQLSAKVTLKISQHYSPWGKLNHSISLSLTLSSLLRYLLPINFRVAPLDSLNLPSRKQMTLFPAFTVAPGSRLKVVSCLWGMGAFTVNWISKRRTKSKKGKVK